jgi:hypothetical protein
MDGTMKEKFVMGGKLFLEIEATYEVDTSTTPQRMIQTITKANPEQSIALKVGDKRWCIYEPVNDKGLKLNCDEKGAFPTEFNEAMGYTKVN